MHVLELKNPDTGAGRGFLVLHTANTRARRVEHCEKAAHFISTTAAALVRDRFPQMDGYLTTVTRCSCPIGADLWDRVRVT
jgi:hypothetical protein